MRLTIEIGIKTNYIYTVLYEMYYSITTYMPQYFSLPDNSAASQHQGS